MNMEQMLSYNDISIAPSVLSEITHRYECNPFIFDNLPIFTAPMSCVVSESNFCKYTSNHIIPIMPRNVKYESRLAYLKAGYWVAFSLTEFKEFVNHPLLNFSLYVCKICIDVANGHMESLYDSVKAFKEKYPTSVIMVGNIANPQTIQCAEEAGANYIRIGIGGGNGCITSSNTGIHYPIASLIDECKTLILRNNYRIKIIADGGIRGYADVIKALALGADYVMIGSLFGQCEDLHETFYIKCSNQYYPKDKSSYNIKHLYSKFYGMASSAGQEDLYGNKKHTAEGIVKYIPITTTLPKWSENMKEYLQSAMSYCNAKTLDEFYENSKIIHISNNTYNTINK